MHVADFVGRFNHVAALERETIIRCTWFVLTQHDGLEGGADFSSGIESNHQVSSRKEVVH